MLCRLVPTNRSGSICKIEYLTSSTMTNCAFPLAQFVKKSFMSSFTFQFSVENSIFPFFSNTSILST
ncbi:MAG: hypothetical protein EU541_03635 [Promethearchaeota archaeon]|nr:MAG: hypothetical protein EU541_03635 [Candidatus Lokiarchaeota archaeon]